MPNKVDYGEFEQYVAAPIPVTGAANVAATPDVVNDYATPSVPAPRSYWTDPLPSIAGLIGGAGTLTATGNPWLAIGGAGLAQGGAEKLRQQLNQWQGYPVPANSAEGWRQVRDEALLGAGSEAGGQLIGGAVLGPLGRKMMTGALGDPVAAETAMELRGTVGRMRNRGGTALPQAKARMDAAAADLERLLSAGEAANLRADPREFEAILMKRLERAKLNRSGQPGAVGFWERRLASWRQQWNLHPTNPNATVVQVRDPATGRIVQTLQKKYIGIRELNALKQDNAIAEARLSKARSRVGASPRTTLDEAYASEMAKWARTSERRLVPGRNGMGLEEANARYNKYKRLHDVAKDIDEPKPGTRVPGAPAVTVAGTTIPSMSPAAASRLALMLTSPMAGLVARGTVSASGRALRGPGSFYGVPNPYAYPSPSGNLAPGSTVNISPDLLK